MRSGGAKDGLRYCHSQGIAEVDFKEDNLLLKMGTDDVDAHITSTLRRYHCTPSKFRAIRTAPIKSNCGTGIILTNTNPDHRPKIPY